MLTVKRVPTVLSNYQEANGGANSQGAIAEKDKVIEVPIYEFSKQNLEDEEGKISLLNNLLLGEWEERMNRGLFRYDVTTCHSKIIPGSYGYIAQLNEGRHLKKRPTEFRVDQVIQSFDTEKFNFTKIGLEEVLFRFEPRNVDSDTSADSPNIVAINVSPIEYGHVLLIPKVLDCLAQRIDKESMSLALYFAKEAADPFFRVGYNSLGAFGTINHLHFQAYYLAVPFPVEKAGISRIMVKQGMYGEKLMVSELVDYPVRGLVFEGGGSLDDLSEAVSKSCLCLQNHNMPFNLLIADCGKKVYMFPQCYAEKQALGEVSQELLEIEVNPAVWEISGHIVLKWRKDYEEASEELAWNLLSQVSLSYENFEEFKVFVCESAQFEMVKIGFT